MAAPRSYEIRLFDQTLVAFSISDGIFGPEVKLQDFDNESQRSMPSCAREPRCWRQYPKLTLRS